MKSAMPLPSTSSVASDEYSTFCTAPAPTRRPGSEPLEPPRSFPVVKLETGKRGERCREHALRCCSDSGLLRAASGPCSRGPDVTAVLLIALGEGANGGLHLSTFHNQTSVPAVHLPCLFSGEYAMNLRIPSTNALSPPPSLPPSLPLSLFLFSHACQKPERNLFCCYCA